MIYPAILVAIFCCYGAAHGQIYRGFGEVQPSSTDNPNNWQLTCNGAIFRNLHITIDKTKRIIDWDLQSMFKINKNETVEIRYIGILLHDSTPFHALGVPNGATLECNLKAKNPAILNYCPTLYKGESLIIGWPQRDTSLQYLNVLTTKNHVYVKNMEYPEDTDLRTWTLPEHLKGKDLELCIPNDWQYVYVYAV